MSIRASLVAQTVKNACNAGDLSSNPLEEGMATQSSILAWRIPDRLQSKELQRFGHD